MQIEVTGFANGGGPPGCSNCAAGDGTYCLPRTGACQWADNFSPSTCPELPGGGVSFSVARSGANIVVQVGYVTGISQYVMSLASFNCSDWNTVPFDSVTSGDNTRCSAAGLTVRIRAVSSC